MSRLIDADSLLLALDKRKTYELADGRNRAYGKGVRDAMKDVDKQPTVDAVPVVRCIECKYASFSFHQGELYISCENNEGLFRDVPEDGYCYCGEKVTE